MKRQPITAFLVGAAILTAAGIAAGQTAGRKAAPPAKAPQAAAMETVRNMMPKLATLVEGGEKDASKALALWDSTWQDGLAEWSAAFVAADGRPGGGALDAWRAPREAFLAELNTDGRKVVPWSVRLRRMSQEMEEDAEALPKKTEAVRGFLQSAEAELARAEEAASDPGASIQRIDKGLESARWAATYADHASRGLIATRDLINERLARYKADVPADVAAVLGAWLSAAAAHPGVEAVWTSTLADWSQKRKKAAEDFQKNRKAFEAAGQPILKGDILAPFGRFKGKDYRDLAAVVDPVKVRLIDARLKAVNAALAAAALRKELEKEKEISAAEKKQVEELRGDIRKIDVVAAQKALEILKTMPSEDWGIAVKYVVEIYPDLDIPYEDVSKKSVERNQRRTSRAMVSESSKEELAMKKALEQDINGALEKRKKAQEEIDSIMAKRKERRAKLGLSPDFD